MKNNGKYPSWIISAIIPIIITSAAISFFLKSNVVYIHRGTILGGLISVFGVLLIIVVCSALSLITILLMKKYQKKNEK